MLTFSTVSALSRGALSDWESHKTGFSGYITIPFLGRHLPTLNIKKYTEYNNGYVHQLNSTFNFGRCMIYLVRTKTDSHTSSYACIVLCFLSYLNRAVRHY